MVVAGGAVLLADADAEADRVGETLDVIVRDRGLRDAMALAARSLARPDAAERVADLVERHARPVDRITVDDRGSHKDGRP
jgi:UDP-N-acetylglucosamine--N-acetylmuramyl-(pentapeptide) pyrophosphoryl-undecaprenol N-acetylglucosamine transferase